MSFDAQLPSSMRSPQWSGGELKHDVLRHATVTQAFTWSTRKRSLWRVRCVQLAVSSMANGRIVRVAISYSPAILRDLGWPADADRIDAPALVRGFLVCLRSSWLYRRSRSNLIPSSDLRPSSTKSTMLLTGRAGVRTGAGLKTGPYPVATHASSSTRRWGSTHEHNRACVGARAWADTAPDPRDPARRGRTAGHVAKTYSVSALERYQDCPFKSRFHVLKLDEFARG